MSLAYLAPRIADALSPLGPSIRDPLKTLVILSHGEETLPEVDNRVLTFLTSLKREPRLALFENTMQVMAGAAVRFGHVRLAYWLLSRASESTSESAIADLERYLAADHLPFHATYALMGVVVEE